MAKITELLAATALSGTEQFPLVQGGDTKRATFLQFLGWLLPLLPEWLKGEPGAAGNVAANILQLKAAAIAERTMLWEGAPFTWETQNAPYTPDEDQPFVTTVESDHQPAGVGAWVRQGAERIMTKAALSDAATLTQSAKNATALSVLEFIPESLHAAILLRTLGNDKTAAQALTGYIQKAIDAAATQRRKLHVPAGLYQIAPVATFASEAGPCHRCFAIRSYMEIEAESGASFRIVNGVSSDASPVFMSMFGSNEILNNVTWRGLEMDMNGANNLFSPNRNTPALPNNGYNLFNQAHIYISGTVGGQAARINNGRVERCRVINTYGVSCIVMAQSNTVGSGVGSGWKLIDNEFRNNGFDTIDHSSVYAWAEDVIATGNIFENDVQFDVTGGLVAWEVHGSNQIWSDNTVRRYYQGCWIDGNATNSSKNIQITYNAFDQIKAHGVMYFGRIEAEESVVDTTVSYNEINLDASDLDGEDLKIGIGCTGPYSQTNAKIMFNRVRAAGTSSPVAAAGVVVAAGIVSGQKHDRFTIEGNTFEYTSYGVLLSTNNTVGLGAMTLRNNEAIAMSVAGIVNVPQGIAFAGGTSRIDALTLEGNQCNDDRPGPQCAFGIRLEGIVGRLINAGNTARGMTIGDYAEAAFAATTRVPSKFQAIDVTSVAVGGNQVVGARGAAVADATDAASAVTQLNALLARARAHGLIAP